MMKIGILGSGDVGKKLGSGFISIGHEVMLGSRDPDSENVRGWIAANGKTASGGTFEQTATFGEIIVLATLWTGTENAIKLAGAKNFAGKVVIDATNPLIFEENKPPSLALGFDDSAGEQVQRWLPGARVVKCFNIVGNQYMVHPQFECGPPDMFIAGDDDEAKNTVTAFLKQFGWSVIDIGGIDGARLLEPMSILWVLYGIRTGTWHHAFKMLR
jgi:8-hydroxy-5-deazaflavin:NADPH oxidoreductase